MALKGQPSTAHEYNKNTECIHCGMYKKIVDLYTHVCTSAREAEADAKAVISGE
jgi:hypothetical protein